MAKNFLSRSCYNALSNLQLQSRLPGASQRGITESFAARSRATGFGHSLLHTRKAGASHHIDQRSRSADNGDGSTLLRTCQIFVFFFVKPSSRYSLVHFLPTSSSNSVPHVTIFQRFEVQIELSPQSCAHFVDNFPRSSRGPTEILATPGATLPVKTQGFPPESAATCEVTRFRTAALPNYLVVDMMMWLT